jgi:hypothetical protein
LKMRNLFLLLVGLVLIANFAVLMIYGDTLQSTHLFIVRSTIFYPAAFINLFLGIATLIYLGITFYKQRTKTLFCKPGR